MSFCEILRVSNNRSRITAGPERPYRAQRREVLSPMPRSRAAAGDVDAVLRAALRRAREAPLSAAAISMVADAVRIDVNQCRRAHLLTAGPLRITERGPLVLENIEAPRSPQRYT